MKVYYFIFWCKKKLGNF